MGITFTDSQLRIASKDVLDTSVQLSILAQQDTEITAKQNAALEKESNNKLFYDFYAAIISNYATELLALGGKQITQYSESELINAAKQVRNCNHYPMNPPTTVWTYFTPKILSSNNGLPITNVSPNEFEKVQSSQTAIDEIKTGFTYVPAVSSSLFSAYTGNPVQVTSSVFLPNQRIVISNAGVSLVGYITAVNPGTGGAAQDLTITVLQPPLGALPIGSSIANNHPGFTNAQREHTAVTTMPEVLVYQENLLTTELLAWQSYLSIEKVALQNNEATGTEATEIQNAINAIDYQSDNSSSYYNFTQAPYTGPGGQYGDSILNPLDADLTTRLAQVNTTNGTRYLQIINRLGSVSQSGEGVSGYGQYFNLWKWIVQRCAKGIGSLFTYYSLGTANTFIDTNTNATGQKDSEYASIMTVYEMYVDANGTNFVTLKSVAGLSVSDAVVLMDDDIGHPVVHANILAINGETLTLDTVVNSLTVELNGRLVKYV